MFDHVPVTDYVLAPTSMSNLNTTVHCYPFTHIRQPNTELILHNTGLLKKQLTSTSNFLFKTCFNGSYNNIIHQWTRLIGQLSNRIKSEKKTIIKLLFSLLNSFPNSW